MRIGLVCAVALAGLASASRAAAQYAGPAQYEEPRWLKFNLVEADTGIYAEGTSERAVYDNSNGTVSHQHFFVGPGIGFKAAGSVYHPNLLNFNLNADGAYGWSQDRTTFSGSTSVLNEAEYLGGVDGSANILQGKALNANLFGGYNNTVRQDNFFTLLTVESWRYGARLNYLRGPWSVNADYVHHDEISSNPYLVTQTVLVTNVVNGIPTITVETNKISSDQQVISHDDTATLTVRNMRVKGGSTFNYSWDQYTHENAGTVGEGTDNSVNLADAERFGPDDKYKANVSASYSVRENSQESSDELTGDANLGVEQNPHLTTYTDVNYDLFKTGEFSSSTVSGQGSVTHQLYDSLTSTFLVRGALADISDGTSSSQSIRYGVGDIENYTKLLTSSSRLRLGNAIFVDHTEQNTDAKTFITIKNERHTFTDVGPTPNQFTLDLPNVIDPTIEVTDQNDSQPPYRLNFDYTVLRNGSRTIIQRALNSTIPLNALVLVDYDAQPLPSGNYSTLSDSFTVRLEFWNNLMGAYGRVDYSGNNAPANLNVQTLIAYTVGVDFNWQSFRAGAEYVLYYSSQSDYRAARLYQSYTHRLDDYSSAGIDFTEAWIDYLDAASNEQNFTGIARYNRSLARGLSLSADGGFALRRRDNENQMLATFRPALKYVVGKTTISAGYDYEYQYYQNSQTTYRNQFFIRLRRYF